MLQPAFNQQAQAALSSGGNIQECHDCSDGVNLLMHRQVIPDSVYLLRTAALGCGCEDLRTLAMISF